MLGTQNSIWFLHVAFMVLFISVLVHYAMEISVQGRVGRTCKVSSLEMSLQGVMVDSDTSVENIL